eukprot:766886-Hanusia_phi.AAC.1
MSIALQPPDLSENLHPNSELKPAASDGSSLAQNSEGSMAEPYRPCKRSYTPWDKFFEEGNAAREMFVKKGLRELPCLPQRPQHIHCGMDGCKHVCSSTEEFERHYAYAHVNICSVCKKNLRTCRLLGLHVQEAHDSFFQEMAKRENMYECLVEGCGKKFKGDLQRHWHLVNVHRYPRSLQLSMNGICRRKRQEGKNKSKAQAQVASEDTREAQLDEEMEDLCEAVGRVSIPPTISFGARREVAFERRPRSSRTSSASRAEGKKTYKVRQPSAMLE